MKLFVLIIFLASVSTYSHCSKPPSEELLMSIKSMRNNFDSFDQGLPQNKETENEKQASYFCSVNSQLRIFDNDDETADSVLQYGYSHSIDTIPATVEPTGSNISGKCDMATHMDCSRDYKLLAVLSAYISLICGVCCVMFSPFFWLYGILYAPRMHGDRDLDEGKLRKTVKKLKFQQSQKVLQ